jgi:RNA polymerase sigma-70 factor (ECF subfamily)
VATPDEREELELVQALRQGEEAAFRALVDRYHASMVRLAMSFVSTRATAEEVTQEAWVGVLRGLDRFEGRSSLRTWIFRILTNTAKTRAVREGRQVPFSSLADPDDGPAVDPSRFQGSESRWADHWAAPPTRWETVPDASILSGELRNRIDEAIAALPAMQRQVITLRDVDGWGSEEVCNVLELSETNQRVLLHRARSKVRTALEAYFAEGEPRV